MFEIGTIVVHPIHGEGTITNLSASKTIAVVKYPTSKPGEFYFRTHWIGNLKGATL